MEQTIYFVTGNKNKVEIFNKVMRPEIKVVWFKPLADIPELESRLVQEVVIDKLEKAYQQFDRRDCSLFVTDVGLYIDQLSGRPGAFIKRETQKLFNGNFTGWCTALDPKKPRSAYVQMIIAAKTPSNKTIIIDHRLKGYISEKPLPGPYGFAWDEIFVPDPNMVNQEYRDKSFAQTPEEVKLKILVHPAIKKFKQELL